MDETSKLWDVDRRDEIATLKGHTGWVLSAAFSPDGRLVATGGGEGDQTVKLWDVKQARELATLPKQKYMRVSVALSPAGDTLLAVAVWTGFQLWELPAR